MKLFFIVGAVLLLTAACTHPSRDHRMSRDYHHHECNKWVHHDHDDQHGGSFWHTHCTDDHK